MSQKYSLHECSSADSVFTEPCLSGWIQHLMFGVILSYIPSQYTVSLGVMTPSASPATAISGLKVEPGAILVWVALFTSGVDLSFNSLL